MTHRVDRGTRQRITATIAALALALALASADGRGASGGGSPYANPLPAPQPLRVLLLTGGGYHDYAAQQEILARGIGARANVEFTIDHEAGTSSAARLTRHADPDWPRTFDLVLYNTCFADVTNRDYVNAVVQAHVAHRVPAVVLHCTMHTYNFRGDNPVWSMFLGVRTQRHQRQQPFTVETLESDHPIMTRFPASWNTPQGELYQILDVYPTATPLAHAAGLDGNHHVTIWTNDFAGVRVFGTTIGHHNETMSTDVYLDVVTAGLLWAADRLDDTGRPLPGYEAR